MQQKNYCLTILLLRRPKRICSLVSFEFDAADVRIKICSGYVGPRCFPKLLAHCPCIGLKQNLFVLCCQTKTCALMWHLISSDNHLGVSCFCPCALPEQNLFGMAGETNWVACLLVHLFAAHVFLTNKTCSGWLARQIGRFVNAFTSALQPARAEEKAFG